MPTFRDDLHLGHSVPMVDTEDIVDGAITEPKLADDSVSTRTIQDGAVTEPKIAEKAITEPKLADAAVSTRTIKFRAVTESKIGDSAVSTRTIQNGAVTNPKIANGAVSMNKLDNEVQTLIQRGADSSWTPKGDFNIETTYDANDVVFDSVTNSSYLSLRADNTGHPVDENDEEYEEGWWMKVIDGSYEKEAAEIISEAVEDVTTLAEESEDAIQSLVDNLPVTQVTGQSTTSVMSQKSVTDELNNIPEKGLAEQTINWASYSNIGNIIAVSTGKWTSSATNKTHRLIPVGDYLQFKIKASSTQGAIYTFLKDDTVVASGTPNYATGYDGVVWIDAGNEKLINTVPSDAVYLYISRTNSGTNYTPEYIHGLIPKSTIGYEVGLLENKMQETDIKFISSEKLNLSAYPDRSYVIAISTNKWSGGYDGKIHKLIPVSFFNQFKITASASSAAYYTFLTDNYVESGATPHYANGYSGLASVNIGQEATVSVPSNAAYLYVHIINEGIDYTPASIYGNGQVSNITTSNSERISKLEENNIPPLAYYGGKIDLKTYHYAVSSFLTSYTGHQSGAAFGDYYFMLTNKMTKVYVWNLSKGEIVYTWSNPTYLSDIHHCNQCSFGTTYYDANDPFPLLYVTVNNAASGEYAGRCSQEVYRVVATYDAETEEYTSFDFTLVQVIYLPVMTSTNCLGNANMAIDSARNRMVFYSRDNNSSQGWCRITEFNIPSYTAGNEVVTTVLEDSNILNGYFIDSSAWNMQGGTIYKGKLFIARGSRDVGYTELIVVDLISKSQIATIDLLSNGFTVEPEGTFIWNNQVCISTNGSKFYNFTFE